MEYVVAMLVAILATLVVAVFELRKISDLLRQQQNAEFQRSEPGANSPTINVNLGALPVRESRSEQAKPAEKAIAAVPPPPEPEPEAEIEPEPELKPANKWTHIPQKATTSGLTIVKCPKCEAENSSFRNECFNCGAAL